MRPLRLVPSGSLAVSLIVAALAAPPAQSQSAQNDSMAAPIKPYKPVMVQPPPVVEDAELAKFRMELANVAARKDRAALAKLVVSKGYFWLKEDGNAADPKKSGLDNLAEALGLGASDGSGWDALAAFAAETTAVEDPDRSGVVCSPADPIFDIDAVDKLVETTETDFAEWVVLTEPKTEVRSEPRADASVVETLGPHLVRALPDEDEENAPVDFIRVATPSGKTGYIAISAIALIGGDQLCFTKEGGAWKIAGYAGYGITEP